MEVKINDKCLGVTTLTIRCTTSCEQLQQQTRKPGVYQIYYFGIFYIEK